MSYTLKYTGSEIDDILDRAVAGGEIDTELAGKQDVLTFDDAPTEGSNNPVKSGGVYSALEKKLDADGVAVSAEAILGGTPTTDTAPYLYRLNPYGNRVKPCIVGASVGANQLMPNGNFAEASGWYVGNGASLSIANNKATVTLAASTPATSIYRTAPATVQGYKYLVSFDITASKAAEGDILLVSNPPTFSVAANTRTHISKILYRTAAVNANISIRLNTNATMSVGDTFVVENVTFVDLTLAYGSAIADKAYEKESATAGSGIAWLRSYGLLPEGYEAYNAGSIKSVNTSGRKTIGINQWDEEWEVGGYNIANGEKTVDSTRIRCANPIPVVDGESYYALFPSGASAYRLYYDATGAYVGNSGSSIGSGVFTVPSGVRYITFYMNAGYGTTYNHDISINYPATDTDYHAYEAYTYPTEATDLRGIFKLSGDTIYADGDLYPPSGEGTVNWTEVDMGDLNWSYTNARFSAPLTGCVNVAAWEISSPKAMCALYPYAVANAGGDDKVMGVNAATLYINDSAYTSKDAFVAAVTGKKLIYKLATPTSVSLTPYTEIQQALTTEEWLGSEVPVGQSSEYYKDIVKAIEGIPEAPTANGTYTLTVTVSGGVATYGWASGGGLMLSMSAPAISPSITPGLQHAEAVADILSDEPEAEEPAEEAEKQTEEAGEE